MLKRLFTPRRLIFLGVSVSTGYYLRENGYTTAGVRFGKVAVAATRIFVDYDWSLNKLVKDTDEYKSAIHLCHLRSAKRLLRLCEANGGVFIKVGQHLASLQYLLPEEYTSVLSVLHSKAPRSELDELREVFRKTVGKELDDVFDGFKEEPCGVASLAQVHEAYLRTTGERVAVKIQHPQVKALSVLDVATMELFVHIAGYLFPDFHFLWLVDETKKNLPRELDFLNEANNTEVVRSLFSHLDFLKIPKVHYEYSSDSVLTMEFCEGYQINDLKNLSKIGINTHEVCQKIAKLYSEMIFKYGIVHADPHPGNVLVRKEKGKAIITLLDHGLYSNLDDEFRVNYSSLWMALLKPDKEEIKLVCDKMGIGDMYGLFTCIITARSFDAVMNKGITRVEQTAKEREYIKEFAVSLMPQISLVLEKMPRSMLLILKTNDLLRAIEYRFGLHNRSDAFLEMARCCTRAVYEHRSQKARSVWESVQYQCRLQWTLLKIFLFELFLHLKEAIRQLSPSVKANAPILLFDDGNL